MLKGSTLSHWSFDEEEFLITQLRVRDRLKTYILYQKNFPGATRTLSAVNHKLDRLMKRHILE